MLVSFLRTLFGKPEQPQQPPRRPVVQPATVTKPTIKPAPTPPKPATVILSEGAKLTAEKLLAFAIKCDNFYNGGHFTEQQRRVYGHDLPIFISAGDLKSVSYEVLSAKDPTHVLWAWDAELPDTRGDDRSLDDIVAPEFRALLADAGETRFIVRWRGRKHLYAGNKLLGNWQDAQSKIRAGGSTRDDRDALRGTGGRVKAKSWSADSNKVELQFYKLAEGGYGFALSPDGVQVHVDRREFNGGGLPWNRWRELRPGTKVRALLVPCRRQKDGTPSMTAQAVELVA